jgi:allophanate hydrolase subunit 2
MKSGARSHLAVALGIEVPIVLGSPSTYALGTLGGFSGRKLAAVMCCRLARQSPVRGAALSRLTSFSPTPNRLNSV